MIASVIICIELLFYYFLYRNKQLYVHIKVDGGQVSFVLLTHLNRENVEATYLDVIVMFNCLMMYLRDI